MIDRGVVGRWSGYVVPILTGLTLVSMLVLASAAMHFAADTPFALIDDYGDWRTLELTDNRHELADWLSNNFGLDSTSHRWRPFFDSVSNLSWSVFRDHPVLHHLFRYASRLLTSVLLVVALAKCLEYRRRVSTNLVVGLSFMAFAVAQFYPIAPEARLAPQELWTGCWLAVLILLMARSGHREPTSRRSDVGLVMAFGALLLTKETNTALGAVFVVAFFLTSRKTAGYCCAVLLVWAVLKVGQTVSASEYARPELTMTTVGSNITFVVDTVLREGRWLGLGPPVFGLTIGLMLVWGNKLRQGGTALREVARAHALLILVSSAGIAFLVMLLPNRIQAIRYAFPLVLLLAIWMPLALLAIYEETKNWEAAWKYLVPSAGLLWTVAFLWTHAPNYLFQFASQAAVRRLEEEVLTRASNAARSGNRIGIEVRSEFEEKFVIYFQEFRKRFGPGAVEVRVHDGQALGADEAFFSRTALAPRPGVSEHLVVSSAAEGVKARYRWVLGVLGRDRNYVGWHDDGAPWGLHEEWRTYRRGVGVKDP